MAEASPLTTAHNHVLRAVDEQNHKHWTQAAEQHQKASAEFSRTSRSTTDAEALRILKLLEDQHQRLSRIVKSYDAPASAAEPAAEPSGSHQSKNAQTGSSAPTTASETTATPKSRTSSALAAARAGSQVRESSPSLARDIASRRGIPPPRTSQPSAAAQARARDVSPESHRSTRGNGSSSKIPPSIIDSQANRTSTPKRTSGSQEDDDNFAKFYTSITTGTMSKLSSALAFAGLPLNASQESLPPPTPKSATKSAKQRTTVKASNDPDVNRIFSKAALEAVEDEHRRRGTFGHGFGPAESFYVVQKGGGTYSYADIARAQQQHQQSSDKNATMALSGIDEEDDEAFVDAKEIPGPPSPKHSRSSSAVSQTSKQKNSNSNTRVSFGKAATSEEMELENATLKQTLEHIANRLAVFEAHAQDASMAALTQSMVSLRPPAGTSEAGATGGSGDGRNAAASERIRQLEQQVEVQAQEMQKLQTRNSQQKDTLKKFQTKWEEVKKSAKEKDRVRKEREKEKHVPDAEGAEAITTVDASA